MFRRDNMQEKETKGKSKRKFETGAEAQAVIDEYFKECEGRLMRDGDGKPVFYKGNPMYENRTVPSVAGLNRALGYSTRYGVRDYIRGHADKEKGDPDSVYETFRRALLVIEEKTVAAGFTKEGFQGAKMQLVNYCSYKSAGEPLEVEANIKVTAEEAEKALASLGYQKKKTQGEIINERGEKGRAKK